MGFPGEYDRRISEEALALGYPERRQTKWTEDELRAMPKETKAKFLPVEARDLYKGTPTIFLDDPVPLERDFRINANQERARELLAVTIYQARKNEPLLFVSVVGCMAGGKSTAVYDALGDHEFPLTKDWTFALFKHKKQIGFDGRRIITHGELEGGEVKPFGSVFDILGQISTEQQCPEVVIAEEVQFAFDEPPRPEGTIRQELKGFLKNAKEMGVMAVVFTSLDFDFARRRWPHMGPMLGLVDLNLVVTARCFDCNGIAYFTQRDVCENGNWKPAREDEDRIVPGNVGEGSKPATNRQEVYNPKCFICHTVLPAKNL